MLETIIVILLILWLLGLFVAPATNLIHVLLLVALVVFVIRLFQGRRTV